MSDSEPMELGIPQELTRQILEEYINDNLSDPSIEIYNDKIAQGKSYFEATGNAVFNEALIEVIALRLAEEKLNDVKTKQSECTHAWHYIGHGHNYSCYKCHKCEAEKDE